MVAPLLVALNIQTDLPDHNIRESASDGTAELLRFTKLQLDRGYGNPLLDKWSKREVNTVDT